MKQHFFPRVLLPSLLIFSLAQIVCADDYVLDFSTKAYGTSSYDDIWYWEEDGITWELYGCHNTNKEASYVRFGGRGKSDGVSYIKSLQPLSIAVKEFVLQVDVVNEGVEQFYLYVAPDAAFSQPDEVIVVTAVAGTHSFLPQLDTVWQPDRYYMLEVHWNNKDTDSNVSAQISSLTFLEGIAPPVYEVQAVVNDDSMGTVEVADKTITAYPGPCVVYADPAWELLEGEAEVVQDGDVFTVSPGSDCKVQINFSPAETFEIELQACGGSLPGSARLSQETCTSAVVLPEAVPPCQEYVFAGWAEEPVTQTETPPSLIAPGAYVPSADGTLYAVYSTMRPEEEVQVYQMTVNDTAGWELQGVNLRENQTENYYVLPSGGSIHSPAIDLGNIIGISARVRSFYGHDVMCIADELGNTWGTVTAPSSSLTDCTATKEQALSGTGRLVFTGSTGTEERGVGVAAITISCSTVPVTYASYPNCTSISILAHTPSPDEGIRYRVEGNSVYVEAEAGLPLVVYTLTGTRHHAGLTVQGTNRIELPGGGYLLQVGEKVQKIMVAR